MLLMLSCGVAAFAEKGLLFWFGIDLGAPPKS